MARIAQVMDSAIALSENAFVIPVCTNFFIFRICNISILLILHMRSFWLMLG